MGLIDDFIANAIISALKRVFNYIFGGIISDSIEAIKSVIIYTLPELSDSPTIGGIIHLVFFITATMLMLYIPFLAFFKHMRRDEIAHKLYLLGKRRWLGMLLLIFGFDIYIANHQIWIDVAQILVEGITLTDVLFPAIAINPLIMILNAILLVPLLLCLLLNRFVLVAGLILLLPLGLVLFAFPENKWANRLVRLVFVNGAYSAALALLILMIYAFALIGGLATILAAMLLSLFSFLGIVILAIMYGWALDWDYVVRKYNALKGKVTSAALAVVSAKTGGVSSKIATAASVINSKMPWKSRKS